MTAQQARLLHMLHDAQTAGGRMPSMAEMAAAIGVKSKNGVYRKLEALEAAGFVRRRRRRARAVEVLRVPPAGGLTTLELDWCARHPDLVRTCMARMAARAA